VNRRNNSADEHARPSDSPLSRLLAYIAQQAPHKYILDDATPITEQDATTRTGVAPATHAQVDTPAHKGNSMFAIWPAEPPETDYFQKAWARLGATQQLSQSQQQVPDNAGPLNSNQLIHRALMLMQEQSPAYLQHFLSYVEMLSWMEQLDPHAARAGKASARSISTKKSARKAR